MDYVMDAIAGLDLEELIVITGHLKDVVERYIVEHYDVKARFVEQKTLDGTAGGGKLTPPPRQGAGPVIFLGPPFGRAGVVGPPAGAEGDTAQTTPLAFI